MNAQSMAIKSKRTSKPARRSSGSSLSAKYLAQPVVKPTRNLPIQAKLTIGQPNDKYEQEADRVADQVMRMSDADVAQRVEAGTVQPMQIQRICLECEEAMAQRQPDNGEEETVQAKENPGHTPEVTAGFESRINSLKGGGQLLEPATRSFFELRFGHDFSNVRVHTDSAAVDTAKSINARAFTLGSHVVMGSGEYQPESQSSQRLLSHELTHVIQQGKGRTSSKIQKQEFIGSPLELVARDGNWLIFNRPALRPEVIRFVWGDRISPSPTITELFSREGNVRTQEGLDLELDDTHWGLARRAFAARENLYQLILPAVRQQIGSLEDRALGRPLRAPTWIPPQVWNQFLDSENGMHRYLRVSPLGTDIILMKRDGIPFGGYAEAPTDEAAIAQLMDVIPPTLIRRMIGRETPRQASIRWLADANSKYNQFMWRQIQSGIGPREARHNYSDAVYQGFLRAYIPLIGGHPSANSAGDIFGGILRGQ